MISRTLSKATIAAALAWAATVGIGGRALEAAQIRLKNGMVLEGKTVPLEGLTKSLASQAAGAIAVKSIMMIDNGRQRYFVPARNIEGSDDVLDAARLERFKLPQKPTGARSLAITSLGSFDATEFDEFGRRRVTINTNKGPISVVQGITEINPNSIVVTALTHKWEQSLATSSLHPQQLDQLLRYATKSENPDDRLAIARFYLQAQLYIRAGQELDSIVKDFPELKATAEETSLELRQLQAKQLLSELRRRKKSGQHRLAYQAARSFPTENMSAEVLREVRELIVESEESIAKGKRVVSLLGELQAALADPEKRSEFGPVRTRISESLDFDTLDRLDAFLKLEADPTLKAEDKLALAVSGWMLGSANAGTDLATALRLWNARALVLEYLPSEDEKLRSDLLAELQLIEGFGPKALLQMIPQLPPCIETPDVVPGKPVRIQVPGRNEGEVLATYDVLLPDEYSPNRPYPVVLTMTAAGRPAVRQLEWWGSSGEGKSGQSQRHGYIVIAPEWAEPQQRDYDYSAKTHQTVQTVLRDARKRFNIDSDRIFLSGHGSGGDAAFDIGMSHPDLFAGVIPITGISDKFCKWYWSNSKGLAWYIVTGELDRDSFARNARDVNRMLIRNYDVTYSEFLGRGSESYYEEIHRIFEWMDLHRRQPLPRDLDMQVLRPSDNRFYWLQADEIPAAAAMAAVLADMPGVKVNPMTLEGKINEGNGIYLTSASPRHTLWLMPGLVDFEKRVVVRHRGRQKFNEFVQPELTTILDDLRIRGDRQRVYQAKVVID